MINALVDIVLRHKRIIPVIVALVGIGAYMIPANSLALAAISGSGNVLQTVTQSNSISASNTGKYGGAFADFNLQLNSASNTADVALSNHGGTIKDSGNVLQDISQSNSISATNSGDNGIADASHNIQANSASNTADVHISNHGGSYHGGKIKDSGNVVQSISQSNDIQASNSGSSGSATADNNLQSNDASNSATVHISNHGGSHDSKGSDHKSGKISDSGNVAQSVSQSNSISSSNSGDHGSSDASGNVQSNSASNSADVHIKNH